MHTNAHPKNALARTVPAPSELRIPNDKVYGYRIIMKSAKIIP